MHVDDLDGVSFFFKKKRKRKGNEKRRELGRDTIEHNRIYQYYNSEIE